MAANKPDDVIKQMHHLFAGGLTPRKAWRALNQQGIKCGHVTVHHHHRKWKMANPKWRWESDDEVEARQHVAAPAPAPETREVERKLEGDTARVEWVTAEHVQTEEDLIRVCKIDTTRWRIKEMTVKAYQTGMKLETKWTCASKDAGGVSTSKAHVVQLFSVSAKLERILPGPYMDATDALFARMGEQAPVRPMPRVADDARYIVNLGLYDTHLAKLCWGRETGQDYDLGLAELVYRHAAEDILRLITPYRVSRFVLAIGHDAFHVDSAKNTTTGGTVVDCDGRYPKMIEIGCASHVWLIDRLLDIAPVDGIFVPGNHDRLSSYHLCRFLHAWFRNSAGVSIDLSPSVRKYRRYGQCLFGFRHGDQLSDAQVPTLPGLMAVEAAKEWGETTCREWFLGHRHTSRRFVSRESDELQGVQIRYLSSLSGTDAWHFENGYVGNRRAAEAYLYDETAGYMGHFVAPVRLPAAATA